LIEKFEFLPPKEKQHIESGENQVECASRQIMINGKSADVEIDSKVDAVQQKI